MTGGRADKTFPGMLRGIQGQLSELDRRLGSLPARLSAGGQQTTDWNAVVAPGFFWSTGSANGVDMGLNIGTVEVGDTSVVQRVSPADASRVYVRRSTDNGATWSAWVLEMGRHLTDNAGNGRAYVGTGSQATNESGTYIGMSPESDATTSDAFWFQTPTGQRAAISKAGEMRSGRFISTPQAYAQASGSASTPAGGSVTVTLPSGRFNVTPNITHGSLTVGGLVYVSAKSATSVTFAGRTTAGAALAMSFDWTATQMAAGSASG